MPSAWSKEMCIRDRDVTDRIGAGYTFRYTDENGLQQSATISGTVEDYTVE